MKREIVLVACGISMMLLSGCSNKTDVEPKTQYEKKQEMIDVVSELPDWIQNPEVKDAIASVGISGYSKYGLEVMLPQAEMDGRVKLAGQIQTVISNLQQKSIRHIKIEELDEFEKAFKIATKEVINKIPLSGARRVKMYQSKDGSLFVHMVIEKRAVASQLGDMKELYNQHMQEAKMTRQNIDAGMKVLDEMMDELDKETN